MDEKPEKPLLVDPDRRSYASTGYYVRARDNDKPVNADISELDRDSLIHWLRSRGGANEWAEDVVLGLLGHPPIDGGHR